jgi:hypothetical protein
MAEIIDFPNPELPQNISENIREESIRWGQNIEPTYRVFEKHGFKEGGKYGYNLAHVYTDEKIKQLEQTIATLKEEKELLANQIRK